ncbi:MAG TPA: hypothetical protein VL200_05460 [Lacunisphaera sp.]|jgi:hypothetical protein|nr:hypothetical protein [Lacunisphaera sp.]
MSPARTALANLFLAGLLAVTARAVTATGLGSFEGIEEPLVRYAPATGTFRPDALVNITDEGGGTFRMFLRYRSDVWDADRDTRNTDRQRAEVKGLGVHQKNGETFDYATTWRSSPGLVGANRFCHIFQLKSTDGDSGAPLVTISLDPGRGHAEVRYWSGTARHATVARAFPWRPGVWQTVRLRLRTSTGADGEVLASVNGDEFQGARHVALFRPGATDYRPKWGLYRGVSPGQPLGDDYIEHKDVAAARTGTDPGQVDWTGVRSREEVSPADTLAWLQAQPASPTRTLAVATVATDWAVRDPVAAMAAVERLPAGEDRAEAQLHVFNRWTDLDPAAVLRWATGRAPAAELDPLLWYFATDTTLRYVARDESLAGATLIADPAERARAISHIVLIWARREPAAAARYVAACRALSRAQQAELTQAIAARRR